jgi:hypothetical protein
MMNHQNHGWLIRPNGLKETVNISPDPAGAGGASLVAFQKYQIIAAIGVTIHPNSAVPSPTNTFLYIGTSCFPRYPEFGLVRATIVWGANELSP